MLTELWRVLSNVFLKKIEEKDFSILEKILSEFLHQGHHNKEILVFKDEESIETVLEVISDEYFQIFGDYHKNLSRLNLANLLKSYFLSLVFYLPILENDKKVSFVDFYLFIGIETEE